jgi:glyoxylase-like metal-dependent hydrolase (beta-lactamase superfamily II)
VIGRVFAIATFAGWVMLIASSVQAQPTLSIGPVAPNVYRVSADGEMTLFVVTPDGILLVDSLSRPIATALKAEFETRFPGQAVRYVVHTHHHLDRANGGSIFNGTAELVGHQLFDDELAASRRGNSAGYAFVQVSESIVERFRVIKVGGVDVQVSAVGPIHARDMLAVGFPSARLAFVVDGPPVDVAPFDFGSLTLPDVRSWLRGVLALEFDTLLFDDGRQMSRAAVVALADHLDALIDTILQAKESRRSLASLQAGPLPATLSTGPHAANTAGKLRYLYPRLNVLTVDAHAAAAAQHAGANSGYCAGFSTCDPAKGVVPAGMAGVGFSAGLFGAAVEWRLGGQFTGSRSSPLFDDAFAYREQRLSVLARFNAPPRGSLGLRVVVGVSTVRERSKGQDFVKLALAPVGGRHTVAHLISKASIVVGADLTTRVGRSMSLVVPVRLSTRQEFEHSPGPTDIQVGVGLAVQVRRFVLMR